MKNNKMALTVSLVLWSVVAAGAAQAQNQAQNQAQATYDAVKARGYVTCGVTDRTPGFAAQNADGTWIGFHIDFCRALAAAVLGDINAYRADDFWIDALNAHQVDVLHAGSTWTLSRDIKEHVEFTGVNFYDGQGFLAHAKLGVKTLAEAMKSKDVNVCVIASTSTAKSNLDNFMARNKVQWQITSVATMDGMWRAFFGGRCNMAIHDRSALAGVHAGRLKDSSDYVLFPEVISKEPLTPAVRDDDVQWRDIVAWVSFVTIAAEELGINQQNVDDMRAHSDVPEIRRLLGVDPGLGDGLPLDDAWAYRVIKGVGNYQDIFERNLGKNTPLGMARGLNALWTQGGLLYAPPIR